jgi:UDP-glucose 4-epimerase
MVVPTLVRQAVAGRDLTVYGDGTQTRCFLHVEDAVHAIIGLSKHGDATGRAFNVGSTQPISILELAGHIIARTASNSRIRFVPYDEAYDEGFEELGRRQPDTSAAFALLGWRPVRSLDQALDDVIAFERAELAAGAPDSAGSAVEAL